MKLYARALSVDEKEHVHKQSVRILEEVGIKFPSERALSLLEKNGAKVDWDEQIAYINEAMVKSALLSTPKEFTLGGRDPEFDLKLPTLETAFNLDYGGIWTYDYGLGKRRPSLTEDSISAARIFDEINLGYVACGAVSPTEGTVPPIAESIFGMWLMYKNCRKHLQDEIKDTRELDYQIGILKAILGSVEEIKRRKIYSVTYCTISPLAHEAEMMEATMDICHYDVPILAFPMAGAGSTAPASLASTIAMANAEILSIFVLFQCENSGVPIIYGDTSVVTNRRNGLLVTGSAEAALISSAMQEMATYYGLPSQIGGCGTDAKEPGIQAVIEKTLTTLPLVMLNTDIIQGIGTLDAAMLFSLEQMLIDEEIAMMCKRLRDGINFSPEMDFFEDVKAVGPTGHFLKQKNTRAAFRSAEYYNPTLADRDTYEDWIKLGSPDMYKNAHKRVNEILATDQKSPLSANVIKEIDEIVEEASRVLV